MRSIKYFLRRYPVAWWVAMTMVSVLTGISVFGSISRSHAAAERLGNLVLVTVAAKPLTAGEMVTADEISRESWPQQLLPQDSLEPSPVGKVIAANVPTGVPLTSTFFAERAVGGPAARLRPGERGIAIPVVADTPTLTIGDWIDLYASDPSSSSGPADVVATGLRIVDVRSDAIIAAGPEADVRAVAGVGADRLTTVLAMPTSRDEDDTTSPP